MMEEQLEILRILSEAEDDVINGRVEPIQNTFDNIRNVLEKRKLDECNIQSIEWEGEGIACCGNPFVV